MTLEDTMATTPATRIRLLLADVDGTLVTEQKVLTERAQAAIHKLAEIGVSFAITSGRPPRGMAMLTGPLQLSTPMAGFNGGVFANPDESVIEAHTIDPQAARKALEQIDTLGLDAWLYTATEWQIRKQGAPHVEREQWTVKFAPKVVEKFSDADLDQAVKIVGVSDDRSLVEKAEKAVQQALGDSVSAARSQPYYLDVTHKDANKGGVVAWLSKRLSIPPEAVATIGDQPNDVLMFRRSGFSIAMGNASDEVKRQASATTDSYNDEGFAKAVERFILRGEEEAQ
jgi:Cof subfamily protein (haloacid dehalogenase superfamily)